MSVIIDTNVVVSGVFAGGPPQQVLSLVHDGELTMLVTPPIVAEYRRTFAKLGARTPWVDAPRVLEELIGLAHHIEIRGDPPRIGRDPNDDMFISCALATEWLDLQDPEYKRPLIVTGDKDLLVLNGYAGIVIVTPRVFLDRHL
jgi:putative PIN family toxin of toxin-antitoxin system